MTEYHIPGASPAFVHIGQPFRLNSIKYPRDWLEKVGPESVGAVAAPAFDPRSQTLERDTTGWRLRDKTGAEVMAALQAARAAVLAEIDRQADVARRGSFTADAGQAAAYRDKEQEARNLLGGGPGPWPFLTAEAEARNIPATDLARSVMAAAERAREQCAAIEARRRSAKRAAQSAATADEVAAVLEALCWPQQPVSALPTAAEFP
jgi:hypothetical protein